MELKNKSILITGGTGSFGKKFLKKVLDQTDCKRIVVYSRDELKQYQILEELKKTNTEDIEGNRVRFFIGDVRDLQRLDMAMKNIDYVVHAAALKQVPAAEYNPMECIKTNVLGAQNIIDAAINNNVKKVVALSTDKAANPVNLYGATKLASDKLFIAANNLSGNNDLSFSVVRYGNVFGSRGSVVPFFMNQKKNGELPITDLNMTRFNITIQGGIDMIMYAIKNSIGGEIFIPKIPSYKITDLANAICPSCKLKVVGIRPGEKLHEEMITSSDSFNTYDLGKMYVIIPGTSFFNKDKFLKTFNPLKVPDGFDYNSESNLEWESIETLQNLIHQTYHNE